MKRIMLVGLGLAALGMAWRLEEDEDGRSVAYAPLILALAIEVGVFLLRRHQSDLLAPRPSA